MRKNASRVEAEGKPTWYTACAQIFLGLAICGVQSIDSKRDYVCFASEYSGLAIELASPSVRAFSCAFGGDRIEHRGKLVQKPAAARS